MTSSKGIAKFCFLLFAFCAWFSVLMPWDKLPDPDAFYHATMAKLTWERGPITDFPWLDLTTLGEHYADQHFLFHVLQSPFVHYLGLAQGSRVSSLLFATLSLMGVCFVFYRLRLRPFWLWPLLLALANPFSTRMVLGKASPIAIVLWLIGLSAALTPSRLHPVTKQGGLGLVFIASLLFALTHGGWIILPGSILILIIGQVVYFKAIENKKWLESITGAHWFSLVSSVLGIIVGLLLHPGRNEMFQLLWIQVIKIGLITPQGILPMGVEWEAASPGAMLAITSVFGIILLLIIPGLIFARLSFQRKSSMTIGEIVDRDDKINAEFFMRFIISWSLLMAFLTALTLKSSRFSEYFLPALALWTAALAQLVDWKELFNWLSFGNGTISKHLIHFVIVISIFVVIAQSVLNGFTALHNKSQFKDNQYLSATQAISDRAMVGDRVYHSQWDEFPVLFSRDRRLKYVAGLDPNFLYEASTTLALDYFNLSLKGASSTREQAWDLIHARLGAKFVLVDTNRWPDLAKILDSDQRYEKIGQGQDGVAYQLVSPSF